MKIDKGVPVRLLLYTLAIGYILLDLLVFEGPLWRHFRDRDPRSPAQVAAAKAKGVVARVAGQPILLAQVERRLREDLWKEGRKPEDLSAVELSQRRRVALETLIDLHLLGKMKVHYNKEQYPVADAEIDAAVARFVGRFPNATEAAEALAGQGWTEKELRYRLAARLQQEKYLEDFIDTEVGEEEAREWYEKHREELAFPVRLKARHIFVSTLNRDPGEAQAILTRAVTRIRHGESFAKLAAELSDDARTKNSGGELGWLQPGRTREDFFNVVVGLPLNVESLVRSGLGWHLVEVTERKSAEERSFESARGEIMAALEAKKRVEGLRLYRRQLREFEKTQVEIFEDVLDGSFMPATERGGG